MSAIKKKTIYFAALIAALIYIVAGNRLNYKDIHLDGATGGGLTVGGVVTEVKVSDAMQPSHPLSSSSPGLLQSH